MLMNMKHKKLAQYLKDHELTQVDFANALGVSKVTVHGWLNGRRKPEPALMSKVMQITGGFLTWEDFYA